MRHKFKVKISILFMIVLTAVSLSSVNVVGKASKLSKPKVSVSEITTNSVTLAWKKVANAQKYQVYRFSYNTGEYEKLGTTKKLMYVDEELTMETKYSYKVQALSDKKGIQNSAKSKAVSIITRSIGDTDHADGNNDTQHVEDTLKIPEEKEEQSTKQKQQKTGELCDKCQGTGNLGHFACTVCNGTGFRDCIMCSGKGQTKCTFCGATGKRWNSIKKGYDICTFCDGTGYNLCLYCTNGKVSCELCNGTGQIPIKCKKCDGTGYVE